MELKHAIILVLTHGLPILFFIYTATTVLVRNRRQTEHLLVALIAICYLLLFTVEYIRNQLPISYSASFSVWLSSIALIIPCLALHFLSNFTKLNRFLPNYLFPAIFYTPLVFVIINLLLNTQLISANEFEQVGMWLLPVYTPGYYMAITGAVVIEFVYITILFIANYQSPLPEQRSIYQKLIIGLSFIVVWQIVFGYLYFESLPPYPYLYSGIIWCYILQLAMKKHDFLSFYDKRYEKLFNMNPNAILLMDKDGQIKNANPRSAHFFEALHLSMYDFYFLLDDTIQQQIALNISVENYEMDFVHHGKRCVLLLHLDFVLVDNEMHILFILQDITTMKVQQEQLHFIAFHDNLTKLPNRLYFNEQFEIALQEARFQQHTITLYLLDVNQFKRMNDTRGHLVGDDILKMLAAILKQVVGEYGFVARLAGDEFIFYVNHSQMETTVEAVIEMIQQQFKQVTEKYAPHEMSLSIGTSQFPEEAADSQALINIADYKMYVAKNGTITFK